MSIYLRAIPEVDGVADDAAAPVRFVASTEGRKRDGKDLRMEDWRLDRYLQHPVVLFAHDYYGAQALPIGTGKPWFRGSDLMMDVSFDTEDEFALRVRKKALKGMMGGSVGWDETEEGNELLEFSIVPVPLDPRALPARAEGMRAWREWVEEIVGPGVIEPDSASPEGLRPTGGSPEHAERIGAMLSKKNRGALEGVRESLLTALAELENLLEAESEEEPEDDMSTSVDEASTGVDGGGERMSELITARVKLALKFLEV